MSRPFLNDVIINPTTASSSPSTGALVVNGGAGIGGNLNIGGSLNVANFSRSISTFTGNGSTTAFTLDATATVNDLIVNVGGIVLKPTTDYTVSGTTLTFTVAPDNTSVIWVLNLGYTLVSTPSNAAITSGTIDGATIGATSPSTGAFTTLSASGTVSGTGFTTLLAPYATNSKSILNALIFG